MKRILTFAAISLVAIASQATTVTWGSGQMMEAADASGAWLPTAAANRAKGTVSAYYYLVTAEEYGKYADAQAIYDAYKANKITSTASSGAIASNNGGQANWISPKDYAVGDKDYMLVVYDYTSSSYGSMYIATKSAIEMTAGGASGPVSNLAFNIGSWTPVPEPCSVALIALGLAALGLKRKVA